MNRSKYMPFVNLIHELPLYIVNPDRKVGGSWAEQKVEL